MSTRNEHLLSEQAYLEMERRSAEKHEYYRGRVVALAGGSATHNRITVNCITSLHAQLSAKGCNVYSSDLRVKIPRAQSYVYPDVSVVCGPEQFDGDAHDLLLNPVVVIEVLSPSTEQYDRGKKFECYRTLPSLQEYLLIAQDARRVDQFVRQAEALWLFGSFGEEQPRITLTSIGCAFQLADLYENVTLPEAPTL